MHRVSEDEHQRVGRVDGRDARRRGRVRVWPSFERVLVVHREGTGTVPQDDAVLLQVRLLGVSLRGSGTAW